MIGTQLELRLELTAIVHNAVCPLRKTGIGRVGRIRIARILTFKCNIPFFKISVVDQVSISRNQTRYRIDRILRGGGRGEGGVEVCNARIIWHGRPAVGSSSGSIQWQCRSGAKDRIRPNVQRIDGSR